MNVYSVLTMQQPDGYKMPNSPRTLEACLRSGFDPSELLPRPMSDYKAPGVPPAVAKIKWDHGENRRLAKVKTVTAERVSICNYLSEIKRGGGGDGQLVARPKLGITVAEPKIISATINMTGGAKSQTMGGTGGSKEELKSGMLELEMKRFQAMKRRQTKEIKRIVESESKMADLQKKLLRAEEEEAERKKEHAKRRQELKAQALEQKRSREAERKLRDEEELARRREMARKEAEFEIKKAKMERRAEKHRAKEAMERELERRNLLEQQMAKTQSILDKQIAVAEASRDKMESKAARVQAMMEKKKEDKHRAIEEQRTKAELRIKEVVDKNKKIQADRKAAFDQKQRDIEIAKKEKAEEDRLKVIKMTAEREAKQQRQKMKFDDAMQLNEDRKQRIQKQLNDREHFIHVVEEQRAEERFTTQLQHELALEDKRQNVERIKRMNEFMRLQTMNKIEDDDKRTEAIREQKNQLLEERRQMAHENFLRKMWVKEAMDQMKVTNKFIDIEEVLAKKSGKKLERQDDADED
jgi:hypothetical protein